MKPAALIALLALTACADPTPGSTQVGVGIGLGPNGMTLSPSVATTIGGVTIGATTGAAAIGATL